MASIASIAFGAVANEFYFVHRFALTLIQTGLLKARVVGHRHASAVVIRLVAFSTGVAHRTGITFVAFANESFTVSDTFPVCTRIRIAGVNQLLRDRIVTRKSRENNYKQHEHTEFRHDVLLSPNGEPRSRGEKKQVNIFLNCE